MNCPSCKTENAENAKFCSNCGTMLTAAESAPNQQEAVGTNTQPVKRKGGCLKWLLISIGTLLGIFILIGIFASNDDSSNVQPASSGKTATSATKEKEEPFNLDQFKQEAVTYPYKDLARNPKDYENKKVVYTGKVVQVLESGDNAVYRINVTKGQYGTYDDTVYVTYKRKKDEPRILEDDVVTFWGISKGLKSYESTLKSTITIPQVQAVAIELAH